MSFDNPFDYEEPQTFYDFAKVLGKPLELQSYLQAVKKGAYKNIKGVEFRHTKLGAVKTWKDDLPWVISLVKLDKKMWEQDEETLKKLLDLIS